MKEGKKEEKRNKIPNQETKGNFYNSTSIKNKTTCLLCLNLNRLISNRDFHVYPQLEIMKELLYITKADICVHACTHRHTQTHTDTHTHTFPSKTKAQKFTNGTIQIIFLPFFFLPFPFLSSLLFFLLKYSLASIFIIPSVHKPSVSTMSQKSRST